jgi:hypothetical protein
VTDLQDLIARVEAATESSVDLFYAVASGLLPDTFPSLIDHDHERVCWRVNVFGKFVSAGAWTDAALALVERVLPGWNCSAIRLHEEACEGHVWEPGHVGSIQGKAPMPALALLLALLRAVAAEDSDAVRSAARRLRANKSNLQKGAGDAAK